MAQKVCLLILTAQFQNKGSEDGCSCTSQEKTGGDASYLTFKGGGELIFGKLFGADTVVHAFVDAIHWPSIYLSELE